MSKKTNGIQVGNFIVTRDNGSEHDWSSVRFLEYAFSG